MYLIDNNFARQNIQSPSYSQKLNLEPSDVSLDLIMAKVKNGNIEIQFAVQINPPAHKIDPSMPITPSNVSMISLRNAILKSIRAKDQNYMILKNFDTRKAIFHLDHNKWLDDVTKGLNPNTDISRFQRVFKLKTQLPPMVLTTMSSYYMEEFVVDKFKDWLESSRKEAKYFKYLIPDSFRGTVRTKVRNMFDWEYDTQFNKIKATLKPMYILALMYATSLTIKKLKDLKPNDVRDSQKRMFSDKVKKNIKDFDRKKWEEFIDRKFI